MGIFSRKQEVNLEVFCRDFYDNYILNPVIGNVDAGTTYYDKLKDFVAEVDQDFASIDSRKFNTEMMTMRFELFALAWAHRFGDRLAIAQNSFTKNYLYERKKEEIWNAMEHYNKAISHSATVGVSQAEHGSIIRMRADLADKYIEDAKKNRTDIKNERIGLVINRLFSENAWKRGKTSYFLILALCHQLGLGYGASYMGPKEEAQSRLAVAIHDFYDLALASLEKIKIVS